MKTDTIVKIGKSTQLFQECPECKTLIRAKGKTDIMRNSICFFDVYTRTERCPNCGQWVTIDLRNYPVKGNNKIPGSDLRANRFVMVEENIMSPSFGDNIINLFKDKIDFVTNGYTGFFKYGNGCWLLWKEYERTKNPSIFVGKRNVHKTVHWMAHTVIDGDGNVESFFRW